MRITTKTQQKYSLPFVLGLSEGIITVLAFIAKKLVNSTHVVTLGFALRLSLAAFITTGFVYYVSQYVDLRRQLLHAERELNLTSSGKLAMTNLGRQIIIESCITSFIASMAAFIGALIPTLIAISLQQYKWSSIFSSIMTLGILGLMLSRLVNGNKLAWVMTLTISGLLITYIGMQLNIVQ